MAKQAVVTIKVTDKMLQTLTILEDIGGDLADAYELSLNPIHKLLAALRETFARAAKVDIPDDPDDEWEPWE